MDFSEGKQCQAVGLTGNSLWLRKLRITQPPYRADIREWQTFTHGGSSQAIGSAWAEWRHVHKVALAHDCKG